MLVALASGLVSCLLQKPPTSETMTSKPAELRVRAADILWEAGGSVGGPSTHPFQNSRTVCSGDGRKGTLLLVSEPKHNPHAGPPGFIPSGLSCLKGFALETTDEWDLG